MQFSYRSVVTVAILTLATVASADTGSSECYSAVEAELGSWSLSPPPPELAEFAKRDGRSTNEARADFDGDGVDDLALLIVPESQAKTPQYIAVCLTRESEPSLHLIPEPYCGDGIGVSPKGRSFYNYDAGTRDTYPSNGVSAYCFEKAGATYLYQGGKFLRVVDSD